MCRRKTFSPSCCDKLGMKHEIRVWVVLSAGSVRSQNVHSVWWNNTAVSWCFIPAFLRRSSERGYEGERGRSVLVQMDCGVYNYQNPGYFSAKASKNNVEMFWLRRLFSRDSVFSREAAASNQKRKQTRFLFESGENFCCEVFRALMNLVKTEVSLTWIFIKTCLTLVSEEILQVWNLCHCARSESFFFTEGLLVRK